MRRVPVLTAAVAAAIAAGALAGTTSGPVDAEAAATFTVTPAQLQINQRISQAAVRRSNEALGLLGPVRPANSTDKNPVNPFTAAQRGKGWPTEALADSAVTTAKLAADSVTEDRLAATVRATLGSIRRLGTVRLTNGQTQVLLTAGPITLTAVCRINVAGVDHAEIILSTTQDGVSFEGETSTDDVTAATPEANRIYAATNVPTGGRTFDQEDNGIAVAPDGTVVSGQPFTAVNLPGRPAGECSFGGTLQVG